MKWRLTVEVDGSRESWGLDEEIPIQAINEAAKALMEFVGDDARLVGTTFGVERPGYEVLRP